MPVLLLAMCAALGGTSIAAQATAAVTAVTIDATIVDGSGRPIAQLTAADFSVQLDGQRQRVVAATYHPSGTPMAGAIGPAFDAVTPAPPVYRLVVQPPDRTKPGDLFRVVETVSRGDAKVQAPAQVAAAPVTVSGTLTTAASSARPSPEERLRAAVASGRHENALPIAIGRALRRAGDASTFVLDIQIEVSALAKAPVTSLLGLLDARGALRSTRPALEPRGDGTFHVDLSVPLEPGSYTVRAGVVDAAGAIGVVESPVDARLTPMGPLFASDLLRWTIDGKSRTAWLIDDLPPAAATIGATLELYGTPGTAPPGDLLVRMSLSSAADSSAVSIERVVTPEARDGVLAADAEFPLERVGRGTYTLRAIVMSGGSALGTVSATVKK